MKSVGITSTVTIRLKLLTEEQSVQQFFLKKLPKVSNCFSDCKKKFITLHCVENDVVKTGRQAQSRILAAIFHPVSACIT